MSSCQGVVKLKRFHLQVNYSVLQMYLVTEKGTYYTITMTCLKIIICEETTIFVIWENHALTYKQGGSISIKLGKYTHTT